MSYYRLFGRTVAALLVVFALALGATAVAQNRVHWPLPTASVPSAIGVNIHFTTPRPGELEQLRDAGFHWIRLDFAWAGIERERGVYNFSAFDRLVPKLQAAGIRILFILDYGNDLYAIGPPRTDEARAAFGRFAAAAVTHFKNQGILWEMWNEPNGAGFWPPRENVDEYIALALATGKAIRQAAPDEWYIGPATSGMDFDFIEKCFKGGCLQYWDAVSFHPYRNDAPETAQADFDRVRDLIARYAPPGKQIPILSGEWGYSELYPGLNLEKQSKYIAREFLSDLYSGLILSIWYDWHDDGTDPKEIEHHFGTVYNDYKPKPTYLAARTLTQTLALCRFNKRLALDSPRDYCLLFNKDENVRLAVWTTDPKPHPVTLPVSAGVCQVMGYTGVTSEVTAGPEGLQITLSDSPQYIVPEGKNALLTLAAHWNTLPSRIVAADSEEALAALSPALQGRWDSGATAYRADLLLESRNIATHAPTLIYRLSNLSLTPGAPSKKFASSLVWQQRNEEGIQVVTTLQAHGLGKIAQETRILPRHPLRLIPYPASGESLPIRVENPTGAPLNGKVVVHGNVKEDTQWVFLKEGETEKMLTFTLKSAPTRTYPLQVTLEEVNKKGVYQTAVTTPPLLFTPYEDFAAYPVHAKPAPTDYAVVPDGDPKVKSQIDWSVVAAPPGLPDDAQFALKIAYDFAPGWKFLRLAPQGRKHAPLAGKPTMLGLWADGDGSGDILNARFVDSTGQTFQTSVGAIAWKGWRYVAFSFTGDRMGHWGGANDGVVHYPISLDTVTLVDSPGGRGGKGVLYVADLTLVQLDPDAKPTGKP